MALATLRKFRLKVIAATMHVRQRGFKRRSPKPIPDGAAHPERFSSGGGDGSTQAKAHCNCSGQNRSPYVQTLGPFQGKPRAHIRATSPNRQGPKWSHTLRGGGGATTAQGHRFGHGMGVWAARRKTMITSRQRATCTSSTQPSGQRNGTLQQEPLPMTLCCGLQPYGCQHSKGN